VTHETRLAVARRLLALSLAAAILAGCQTPVGVKVEDPRTVERELGANILGSGSLSARTRIYLRAWAAEAEYERNPEEVLAKLHDWVVGAIMNGDPMANSALVALAELCFDVGDRHHDPRYFLQSVVYAWGYLFPYDPTLRIDPIDARMQLAIGLYNRGLARAFASRRVTELEARSGLIELPFGVLYIEVDEASRHWRGGVLSRFTVASELSVRGMRNRYRWPGLGVALAASFEPPKEGDAAGARLFPHLRVAAAALLAFQDFWSSLVTGEMHATLSLHVGLDEARTRLEGHDVPLAMEPTATLAYMLAETAPWAGELKRFFAGDLGEEEDATLHTLEPYRADHIPVVLVHGTASGPARWAEMLNDLYADPQIRENYQFWLFTYNTGNPIAYSGWLLRKAIREAIDSVDPRHRDAALQRMVVMGHSQGGLLAKLTVIDSGSVFWDRISKVPIDQVDLSPESREIIEGSLFVKPVPEVERVVFMATPHRGSYVAAWGLAQWIGGLTRAPANLMAAATDLVTQDQVGAAVRRLDRLDGAVANMSPGSTFIQDLASIPIVPRVEVNSIIAVRGNGPLEDETDGVVAYTSAHIDGVESEKIIHSGHSVQNDPHLSLEVRRILLEHIGIVRSSPQISADP